MGRKITVLGAGAWGTAFGQVLADAGNDVTMWAREPEIVEDIRDNRRNGVRLPSVKKLPDAITATGNRAEAVKDADIVVVAIAAQFARVALVEFRGLIPEHAIVVSLMKGIERNTNKRMDEVVRETLDLPADRFAAISGPNLSKEIADRHPAATVVACENIDNATIVAEACTTKYFKAFVTTDVIGLEMCGSLKNVTALAVGMARGAGYGENTAAHTAAVAQQRRAQKGIRQGQLFQQRIGHRADVALRGGIKGGTVFEVQPLCPLGFQPANRRQRFGHRIGSRFGSAFQGNDHGLTSCGNEGIPAGPNQQQGVQPAGGEK